MLTTGVDNIVGTDANETITGVNSGLLTEGTLQGSDKIDGAGGTDTLSLSMSQNWAGFTTGSMKNVETVNITNASTANLSYSGTGSTGVTKYVIDSTKASVTLSDLAALADLEVTGPANTATITAVYDAASTVATGTQTDTQKLKVTNVGTANTKTDGTNNAKIGTVTIAKVEALALETAGDANTLNLTGVSDAKTITVTGAGTTEIQTVGAATTSFDASAATGKMIATLTAAATNSLASVKTGSGDDTVTVALDDLTSAAVISGGTGADTLVVSSAAKTLQATMSGFETMKVSAAGITGAVTFSGTNVTDLETVNLDIAAGAGLGGNFSMANMGAKALTVNAQAATGNTFSADNSGAVTLNYAKTSAATAAATSTTAMTFNNASALTVNVGELVVANGAITTLTTGAVALNVASKVVNNAETTKFTNTLNADTASSLTIKADGELSAATLNVAKATTVNITAGATAAGDIVELGAEGATSMTITAGAKGLDMESGAGNSLLTKLQTLTASTEGHLDFTGVDMGAAASITLTGAASTSKTTLATLGTATTQSYNLSLTASGQKAGLTAGAINAGTAAATVDVSAVTGNVTLATLTADAGVTLNAKNLGGTLAQTGAITTTTGSISVDVSSATGAATVGALTSTGNKGDVTVDATSSIGGIVTGVITGNNVTVKGTNALGAVKVNNVATADGTKDVDAKTSFTYYGTNLTDNGLDVHTSADSTAFTANLNGGAAGETIRIDAKSATQTSMTITGNLGAGTNLVTYVMANNTGTTGDAQTVSWAGLTSSAAAGDATFETVTDISLEVNSAITYTGSVKDDQVKYTAASGGAVITNANAVALSDSTTTDKDNLTIDANAETVVFSNLSLTGIEQLTVLATSTATTAEKITPVADKDTVVINASAISGKAVALLGQTAAFSGDLVLTGTAGVDVIDLSKLTAQDDGTLAVELFVVGGAGNDTIVGSTAASKQKDNIIFAATAAGNGTDSITGFEQGASKDILDFTGFLTATKAAMNAVITANPGGTTALENDVSLVVDIAGGQDITTAAGLKTAIEAGGEYANLDMANSESGIVITAANSDAGTAQNVFYVSTDASGVFTVTLVGTVTGSAVDIDLWHADNFA